MVMVFIVVVMIYYGDGYDEALSKENNGNICSCVTSHGSFDVIKKLLWTLIKDTIILLVLVFVLLLLL